MADRLVLRLSQEARDAFPVIWWYTATKFSVSKADAYLAWLEDEIASLPDRMSSAIDDPELPGAYLWLLKKKPGWRHHGYLVVAYVRGTELIVVDIRHTARERHG